MNDDYAPWDAVTLTLSETAAASSKMLADYHETKCPLLHVQSMLYHFMLSLDVLGTRQSVQSLKVAGARIGTLEEDSI